MPNREEILAALRERIVGFAASRSRRETADDVAQEVLLVLEQKYAHVSAAEELVPLALQIARFKMMTLRHTLSRRGEFTAERPEDIALADSSPDQLERLERREQLDLLKTALATLGDRCRTLFRLKLQGLNFLQIQKEMNAASVNTVYTWDLRCRKELKERLG